MGHRGLAKKVQGRALTALAWGNHTIGMDTKQASKTGKVQISVEWELVERAQEATGRKFVTAVALVRHLLVEASS